MKIKPYYQDATTVLYCADAAEIFPRLEFGAIVTDPPFGLGKKLNGGSWGATKSDAMNWDAAPPFQIINDLLDLRLPSVIWGGNYFSLPPSRGWLCWHKPDAPPTMAQLELAYTNQDKNAAQIKHSIAATNGERCGHPTQKPVAVMTFSILYLLNAGNFTSGAILDPFAGSGSTLVAAKRAGLPAIGIEINKNYCDMAIERLRQNSLFADL